MVGSKYFQAAVQFNVYGLIAKSFSVKEHLEQISLYTGQVFSSPEPKAPGQLIGWEGSVVRRSKYDPGLTLTHFTPRSNLVTGFCMGKSENYLFFGNYCSLRSQSCLKHLTK